MDEDPMPNHEHYVSGPPEPSDWTTLLDAHRAAQRAQILEAALGLLRDRGMAKLTMSALAAKAGIARATLYHYFPDIDAVLSAWVAEEVERSVTAMVDQARAIADPLDRLAYLVRTQAETFASQSHRLSVEHFEAETGSPALRGVVETQMAPLRAALAQIIQEAGDAGALGRMVDPALGADMVLGLLGAIRRRLVAGSTDPETATEAVMGVLVSGWFGPTG